MADLLKDLARVRELMDQELRHESAPGSTFDASLAVNFALRELFRNHAAEVDRLAAAEAALREARRWIGDGDLSDGLHREHWTPAYVELVDMVDDALVGAPVYHEGGP